MKAWILKDQVREVESKPLKLVNMPDPHPRGSEIRIKVDACGICRTDIHIAEGDLPLKKSPIVLGHEIVGVVDELGLKAKRFKIGERVGVTWLHSICGTCKYCLSGRENYCPDFKCTGWDRDGGFAEYTLIGEEFALPLPGINSKPEDTAPLLCPGVAGYCAYKLTRVRRGDKLGLYGFGPTAYYTLRVAIYHGIDVFVSTRSLHHRKEAKKYGALWVGNAMEKDVPTALDAVIVFPPAGALVEKALSQIKRGGILVLAPVSMSHIEIGDYSNNLWGRDIRTLYNINRADAEEFLNIAGEIKLSTCNEVFPFEKLQEALILVKNGRLSKPNAVVRVNQ